MTATPKVSVAVSLYNKAGHIEETVRSALAQSMADFELVVVDDGSTDDGAEKVRQIGDSRIAVHRQDNAGAGAARNRAMREARGRFVAFLDGDDLWRPDHLRHLLAMTVRFPNAVLFGNDFVETSGTTPAMRSDVDYRLADDYFAECAFAQAPLFTSSCMVRRDLALELGGFPTGKVCGEDLALWIRLAAAGPVAISNYVGCCYRRAAGSLSTRSSYRNAPDASMAALEELLVKRSDMPADRARNIREYYFRLALAHGLDCLRAGETDHARRFLRIAAPTKGLRARWWQARLLALAPQPCRELLFRLKA